jgi:hypothetical protein
MAEVWFPLGILTPECYYIYHLSWPIPYVKMQSRRARSEVWPSEK